MPEKTQEELEAEKQAAEAQVDAAGDQAKQEAEQQGISEEEVVQRVEKARQQEKDKLHDKINGLTAQLASVQEYLEAEKQEKERIKREAEEEAERKRQAKLSETERTNEVLTKLEEQLRNERDERERFKAELEERDRRDRVDRYRNAAIQAAGDEIIPDLVVGNSEAEIDEAIQRAKARYKEYEDSIKQRLGQAVRGQMPGSAGPDSALEEQDLENITKPVDVARYRTDENYREQIKNDLARAYAAQAGRA